MQAALTDRTIANIPLAAAGQQIIRDADLKGFFLLIGKRSKSYMIQADLRSEGKRQSLRVKVGDVGQVTAREARSKAKTLLGQIAIGVDPRPKPVPQKPVSSRDDPTLRKAWDNYLENHLKRKNRSKKTIEWYQDHIDLNLKDWLDTPLSTFGKDPGLLRERHNEVTVLNGPYAANGCMRTFSAIYNHARKAARGLPPENPTFAIDRNPEYRRDTAMGQHELADWFEQVRGISNPLRRELHLFLLLSGSRPEVIKTAKIADLDFRNRQLFIPNPKGGTARAFCIPLSREMIRCLIRAIRIGRRMFDKNRDHWLFPGESAAGHIVQHRERRTTLSHYGNDLRQTYRTIGQDAGVGELDMHLLMNHKLQGVNAGYITRSKLSREHLRRMQQILSLTILDPARPADDISEWPFQPARRTLLNVHNMLSSWGWH